MNKRIVTTALALATLLGVALLSGCQDVSTELKAPKYKTGIPETELKMSAFKAQFPQQYASYMKNNENGLNKGFKGTGEPDHSTWGATVGLKHAF